MSREINARAAAKHLELAERHVVRGDDMGGQMGGLADQHYAAATAHAAIAQAYLLGNIDNADRRGPREMSEVAVAHHPELRPSPITPHGGAPGTTVIV